MTTFAAKVRELVAEAELSDDVLDNARAFLQQANDWPVETQVPLSRIAPVLAAMLAEPKTNVRRVMATDALKLTEMVG